MSEGRRPLPRVNGQIDTESLAAMFMARHVDYLSSKIDRAAFEAIEADLAIWLSDWFGDLDESGLGRIARALQILLDTRRGDFELPFPTEAEVRAAVEAARR